MPHTDLTELSPAVREFLMSGTRTAKLAFTTADGRPLVAPVWFVLDGDDIVFTTMASSAKGRALIRDERTALCVDLTEPPYGFVQVQGVAELNDDLEVMLAWATQIGGRYMGADRAQEFGRRNAVEGELLVRVHPTKVIAAFDVTAYES